MPALPKESVVAGYWAIGDEIDVRPLMRHLIDRGHLCALPVVTGPDRPLAFRAWTPDAEMEVGPLGTRHPAAGEDIVPDVLLLPLLAYDDDGYRLGWGGGYYDRTLEALRQTKPGVLAVGAAFAGQRLDRLPRGPYDQPLDWILTEKGLLRISEADPGPTEAR